MYSSREYLYPSPEGIGNSSSVGEESIGQIPSVGGMDIFLQLQFSFYQFVVYITNSLLITSVLKKKEPENVPL